MEKIVFVLIIIALIAVLVSLFLGLVFMTRGKKEDAKKSNKMMHARVWLQGIALALFALALLLGGNSAP